MLRNKIFMCLTVSDWEFVGRAAFCFGQPCPNSVSWANSPGYWRCSFYIEHLDPSFHIKYANRNPNSIDVSRPKNAVRHIQMLKQNIKPKNGQIRIFRYFTKGKCGPGPHLGSGQK